MTSSSAQVPGAGQPFTAAWNEVKHLSEDKLREKFNNDSKSCNQALQWLVNHPSQSAKNVDLTCKFIRCLPPDAADDPRLHKILSFMQNSDAFFSKSVWGSLFSSQKTIHPELIRTLECAIKEKNEAMALALLEHDLPIQNIDQLFREACAHELGELALALIDKGVDPNAKDSFRETPLYCACKNGLGDVALALIDKGADPNIKPKRGDYLFFLACARGLGNVALALIDRGFDLNKRKNGIITPLEFACHRGLGDVAFALINKGVDIEVKDSAGNTLLHLACLSGLEDVAFALINKGADINAKNSLGHTPLHIACHSGLGDVALALIDKGADLNDKNSNDDTPLHFACASNFTAVALSLIDKGADILSLNKYSITPIGAALVNSSALAEYFLKDFSFPTLKVSDFFSTNQSIRLNKEASYLKKTVKEWLEDNPVCSEGRMVVEVPLLLGMREIVKSELMKMGAAERDTAVAFLLKRYPNQEWVRDILYNFTIEHYEAGALLQEKLPNELPEISIEKCITEEMKNHEDPSLKSNIETMLDKIDKRTRIMGLEANQKTAEEVESWYQEFCLYLKHVIAANQIGEEGGSVGVKGEVLQCLAEMQPNCAPRWKQEIQQLYQFRPFRENMSSEEEEQPPSLRDRVLQTLRNTRLEIVTTKLLKYGLGNVHEPNFLINQLSGPLGLRIEHIDDPYANYEEGHLLEDDLSEFHGHYSPGNVINDLTEHVNARIRFVNDMEKLKAVIGLAARKDSQLEMVAAQAKEMGITLKAATVEDAHQELKALLGSWKREAHDPLNVEPQQVVEWLREYVAVEWRKADYAALPGKCAAMRAEGKSQAEIQEFLKTYGVEWQADNTLKAEQNFRQRLQTCLAKEKQLINGRSAVQKRMLAEVQQEIAELQPVLEKMEAANDPEECWELLVSAALKTGEMRLAELERGIGKDRDSLENPEGLLPDDIAEINEQLDARLKSAAELEAVLQNAAKETSLQKRKELLAEVSLLPKPPSLEEALAPKRLKEAQIAEFMEHEVFDEHKHFTKQAVVHLLTSMGVLSQ